MQCLGHHLHLSYYTSSQYGRSKKPYVEPTLQNHENSMHQISQTWKVIDINLWVICYINNLYVSRTLDFGVIYIIDTFQVW